MMDSPINRERLLQTFFELLQINSPSRREGAMARHLTTILRELGAEVLTDNAGQHLGGETGNLIARFPGTVPGPALLFCSHIDTVEPTDRLQVQRKDGLITSDGTTILGADDKSGIAAILEMLRTVLEADVARPTLEIAFTIAEEVGLMGSQVLDYQLLSAEYGFVPDSSGAVGLIITRAPSQKHLKVTIHGKAAHAGMAPEDGISAITIAARAISRLRQGRIDEETTANLGTIHGGKATNIVPDTVVIEGEARSRDPRKLDEQVAHMRACFADEAALAGGTADVEISEVYPAFNLSEESKAVWLAKSALAVLGATATIAATGGGSDANFLNGHGIESVILSTGYTHPHGTNECQDEEQLVTLAEWLYTIVQMAARG